MPMREQMPNQMIQPVVEPIQHQARQTVQGTVDLGHKIIDWLVSNLGAWTILICIGTGLLVWVVIIFRREIKKRFGDLIKLIDGFVNRG